MIAGLTVLNASDVESRFCSHDHCPKARVDQFWIDQCRAVGYVSRIALWSYATHPVVSGSFGNVPMLAAQGCRTAVQIHPRQLLRWHCGNYLVLRTWYIFDAGDA